MGQVVKDPVPLAAALASGRFEVDPLPLSLNFSASWTRFAKGYRHQFGPPFVLHYHRSIDEDGFLLPSPNKINEELDEFNRVRSQVLKDFLSRFGSVSMKRRLSRASSGQRWYRPGIEKVRRAQERVTFRASARRLDD